LDATWVIIFLVLFLLVTVISHAIQIWVVFHSQRSMEEVQRQHNDLVSIQLAQTKTEFMKMSHAAESLSNMITKLFDPLNDPKNGG
jgi:Flp pilus assembly protein TadG